MRKPLRGRRSGPLWFLILLIVGSGVYGVNIYLDPEAAAHLQGALDATATAPTIAVVPSTPRPMAGSTIVSTPTPLPSDTPIPTTTPAPDFYQTIINFRRAERAAFQTLDPNVLDQVPVFAHGEALEAIKRQVETLRTAGQYEVLIVEVVQIEQVMPSPVVGVLVSERHSRQIFERATNGDRLLAQEFSNLKIVYGFVEDDGRWKVDKVRIPHSP
ncbi:MAG: hypothetical protein KF832_18890 [Caldilineaceae bacterium]|nr:hypothetical protein [Caldilineaceae bacterium]